MTGERLCPCCGAPSLKGSEVRILLCLLAAGKPIDKEEIERVTGISVRNTRRAIVARPELYTQKKASVGQRVLVGLTERGRVVATQLSEPRRRAS